MSENIRMALPAGHQLGEYRIIEALGQGGFGITYRAQDARLNMEVAIKEYLPQNYAGRERDFSVYPHSDKSREVFTWGLQRFAEEARILAQLRHPNIVRVLRFFDAHHTSYFVMEYEHGRSLEAALRAEKGRPDEAELKAILLPLLDGLQHVHQAGLLHRDIKPDNIYLRERDQTAVLLDFGAARYALSERSKTLTEIVTPGYSPPEQYHRDGKQGPWSDLYALGAVMYRAISGLEPKEAPARRDAISDGESDPLKSAVEVGKGKYSGAFLQAIDWALKLSGKDRPQSAQAWREALSGGKKIISPSPIQKPIPKPNVLKYAALALVLALGGVWGFWDKFQSPTQPTPPTATISLPPATPDPRIEIERQAREEAERRAREAEAKAQALQQQEAERQRQAAAAEAEAKRLAEEKARKQPLHKQVFRDCDDGCPEMVYLQGGTFQMGSDDGDGDEKPVHGVTVEAFALGKYEVTLGEFKRFVQATGYAGSQVGGEWRCKGFMQPNFSQDDSHPVACVTWLDAVAYTEWLSQKTGKEYRLPTEAEWEYAARGGTTTKYWWGNDIGRNRANCDGCGSQWDDKQTAPVDSFAANPFGLHDTAGNVWEWSCSEYAPYKDGKENACISKNHAGSDGPRVIRGGSWFYVPSGLRSSARIYDYGPSFRFNDVGFRLARMF